MKIQTKKIQAIAECPGVLREHGASQRVGCDAFLHRYDPKHTASQDTAGDNLRWPLASGH